MDLNKVARCVLTDGTALVTALLISLALMLTTHIPPAVLFIQVLAIELLIQAPLLTALNHERSGHQPQHVSAYQLIMEILLFGIMAGGLASAAYWLSFALHQLSPVYIDTTHPFYIEATTVAFASLALCQVLNLVFVRSDTHKHVLTDYLWSNPKLVRTAGLTGIGLLAVVYIPWLQAFFGTASLGFADWLLVLTIAAAYSGLRVLQRHTRQHTRHAVIRLHREVHGNHKPHQHRAGHIPPHKTRAKTTTKHASQ